MLLFYILAILNLSSRLNGEKNTSLLYKVFEVNTYMRSLENAETDLVEYLKYSRDSILGGL